MNVERQPRLSKPPGSKLSILLLDANSERRALRKKIMALHGVEIIGASDLTEASSIWHRDRYDMVLIDIRRDHRGCLAWRDEIKKDDPTQVVAFLVGKPKFIDLEPAQSSYATEEYGVQWGDSMRKAVRDSCDSLPQRNGFVEAGWRIAAARKMSGAPEKPAEAPAPGEIPVEIVFDSSDILGEPELALAGTEA
jgi:CheY-like chemotaxis protein